MESSLGLGHFKLRTEDYAFLVGKDKVWNKLASLDSLCEKCYQGDELLCAGCRLCYNLEASEYYETPIVKYAMCNRKVETFTKEFIQAKYQRTHIPPSLLENSVTKFVDIHKYPFLKSGMGHKSTKEFVSAMIPYVEAMDTMKEPLYVYVPAFLSWNSDWEWATRFKGAGLVVIDGIFETSVHQRDELMDCIYERIETGMPTWITYSEAFLMTVFAYDMDLQELARVIKDWPRLCDI